MNCPYCGYELERDSHICKHCGKGVWICWRCGHETKYNEHHCRHCGDVFWTNLVESGIGNFFVFAFWGLMLSPLYQSHLANFSIWKSILLFAGICAAISLTIAMQEVKDAQEISKGYTECMAKHPRHDCPDWKYGNEHTCVQTGTCLRCGKVVERSQHSNWTEWKNISEISCMQNRQCLRCDAIEARGPDHKWVGKGISEGTGGYYDDYYKYETYECSRCKEMKYENR